MRNPFFTVLQGLYRAIGGHGLGRIPVLRWLYDNLFGLLKPKSVTVMDHKMWLDDRDTLELGTHGIYEPTETELLQRELKSGETFVDIGANIGYYTLIAARIVGPKGRVFAFEPDPTNFALLQRNVQENGYTNVTLINKAMSNKAQTLKLYLSKTNRGDHRVYDSKDGRPSVSIQAVSLDGFFKKLDRKVHFIKMDIQGAEARALDGMKGLLHANRSLKLVTEFSPGSLRLCGSDPQKYLKTLEKLGFKLSEISEENKSVRPLRFLALMDRLANDSNRYTNLYCVKGK